MTTHAHDLAHQFVASTADQSSITLIVLHGSGKDLAAARELGEKLLPSAALITVGAGQSRDGATGYFRQLAEGRPDLPDLTRRAGELADFSTTAISTYSLNPGGIVVVGYSDGAHLAAATLLLHPRAFPCAVLLRPRLPFFPENRPHLAGTPILIECGESDAVVSPGSSAELSILLERCGARVTTHWHNAGHDLTPQDLADAQTWLKAFSSEVDPRAH